MPWEDWQAWAPFMQKHGDRWTDYAYNVRLFTGNEPPADATPELAKMWRDNTAKRIDVVGHNADGFTIFEARQFAGWSAVGQLMGYRDLWRLNYPELDVAELYLVTERCDDTVRALAARQGIRTWCVGEP